MRFLLRARHDASRCACMLLLGIPQEVAKKGTKGFNTPWHPARFVTFAIFWWLPKGVLVSANFASANPKICLLLQAGYLFSLHVAPRFKAKDEKNIIPILHRPTSLITRGGENKNPVRTFRPPRLPLVVAGWRAMPGSGDVFLVFILEERQCRGIQGERLGVLSSLFFVTRQRIGIKPHTERVRSTV